MPRLPRKMRSLLDYLEKEYKIRTSRMSPIKIFMFLVNPLAEMLKYRN